MNSTRVLLLRHAETADPTRFHGAESDVGLGDRGRRQAEVVAAHLAAARPDAVVSSAMRRALDTARPIARACGREVLVEPALHERKMGPLSGTSREEGFAAYSAAVALWAEGDLDATHPGGESFRQIQARVVPVLERLAADWRGQTVVVVAHGVLIRVLLCSLLAGKGPGDFPTFAIDNTAINDLTRDASVWSAYRLNRRVGDDFEAFAW